MLIAEDVEREPGVELRVVHPPPLELTVLVVLDEVVVGIAGEGERVQPQRVDRGKAKQPEVGLGGGELRQVEEDQVVAQNEPGAVGKVVEVSQRPLEVAAPKHEPLVAVRTYRGERVDAAIPFSPTSISSERQGGIVSPHPSAIRGCPLAAMGSGLPQSIGSAGTGRVRLHRLGMFLSTYHAAGRCMVSDCPISASPSSRHGRRWCAVAWRCDRSPG